VSKTHKTASVAAPVDSVDGVYATRTRVASNRRSVRWLGRLRRSRHEKEMRHYWEQVRRQMAEGLTPEQIVRSERSPESSE
jgi:hypothetical protein